MRDQLAAIKKRVNPAKEVGSPVSSWVQDGLDHINVSNRGETELGRILTHTSKVPFKHKVFGRFCSMESFWFFINSAERDDRIRFMYGYTLKRFASKLTKVRVNNFRAIIMDSHYQRILQNPNMKSMIVMSELPFDCYFTIEGSGERQRPKYFKWFTAGLEEIRAALVEGREPDFTFLIDKEGTGIYEFVAPIYHQRHLKSNTNTSLND